MTARLERRHIAEFVQDMLDMERRVRAEIENIDNAELASHMGIALEEEKERAISGLRASWNAMSRMRVIAQRAPQKKRT